MSLKKLAVLYPKYTIELEHQFQVSGPAVKATLTIPSEVPGMFLRRVSTNFTTGTSLQSAEKAAIKTAVEMILGNKQTKKLIAKFDTFSLQLVPFETKVKESPFGVKALLSVAGEDGKPYRASTSLAAGAVPGDVEKEVLGNVIKAVLGE